MSSPRPAVDDLAAAVVAGDRAALARAITLAESKLASDRALAQELLVAITPHTGRAMRVGITGVPGAGKSTTIETLGLQLVDAGKRVAVLVIDPSSSRTGGSILGDKTRMPQLSLRDGAFIRPSPAGGVLGGLARRTREAMLLCEAAGFDVVLVESVGVGQSEAELAEVVDALCLLLVPGAGDELQGIKRGIVELADLIVVNKADGDQLAPARRAAGDYRHALKMLPASTPGWSTPVLTASARDGSGLTEVWQTLEQHRAHLERDGQLQRRRAQQTRRWLNSLLDEAILSDVRSRPGVDAALAAAETAVVDGTMTVPQAVNRILEAAGTEFAEAGAEPPPPPG